ncbi:MAG: MFS transporter [Actinobacteria bacterium]|nr:MFS transporter [Actinomycetota bacterium]
MVMNEPANHSDALAPALVTTRMGADTLAVSLMLVFMTNAVILSVMPIVTDDLQTRFGLSSGQIGLLTSVFMGFYGVAGISSGFFAPRWGGRLLGVTCACFVAGSTLFAVSSSFVGFVTARAIQGTGAGMVVAISSVVMASCLPTERLSRAWGVLGSGWGLGSMLALLVLPSLEKAAGFRAVFLATAGLGLVVGVGALSQKAVRARPPYAARGASMHDLVHSMTAAARNYRVLLIGFANTAELAVAVGLLAWGPLFLKDIHGAGGSTAFYLVAALGAAQLLGNPLGATASGIWGKYPVIIVSLLAMAILTALEGFVPGVALAFCLILLGGFVSMFYFPAMLAYMPEVVKEPEQVGPATGLNALMGFVGSMVAPWIFGHLLDLGNKSAHAYAGGFLVLTAFCLAPFVGMFFFRPGSVAKRGGGCSPMLPRD